MSTKGGRGELAACVCASCLGGAGVAGIFIDQDVDACCGGCVPAGRDLPNSTWLSLLAPVEAVGVGKDGGSCPRRGPTQHPHCCALRLPVGA